MKILPLACTVSLMIALPATANDSTGYVATGGVTYLKNKHITMQSEDLYISKDRIEVAYDFKNLSDKSITETVLFPLPRLPALHDSDFADTKATFDSFKIWANGKPVAHKTHARAFMHPLDKAGEPDFDKKPVDVTAEFKACQVRDDEILTGFNPYVDDYEEKIGKINQKLIACNHPTLNKFIGTLSQDDLDSPEWAVAWDWQAIYEFQQTFAPNAITKIRHRYTPLVGGSVHFDPSVRADFCVDKSTQATLKKYEGKRPMPYSAVAYILTTGANWAKPIDDFRLTIERDKNELVSLCWHGKNQFKKVGEGKFVVEEKNFTPKHDLDIAFISLAMPSND